MKAIVFAIALVAVFASSGCPTEDTCSGNGTCCAISEAEFGCCPYDDAVCCSDKQHCCPGGYSCSVEDGTCLKGSFWMFSPMHSAKTAVAPVEAVCPSGDTECTTKSGSIGCCPQANAVCCSDGLHCCPGGYTCDLSAGTCVQEGGNRRYFFSSEISTFRVGLTLANVVDIINGIFQGIGTDLQYKDVASCINDVITLGTDVVDAVQDFEKGDASSVEAGIKAIGYALEGIPTDITDCKAAYSEAADGLKEMIAVFKDPESFFFEIAKHLIVNHHEIYTEMSTAITDFKAADYEGFGKGLGEALLAVVA